jgi:hypothetical protein
VPAQQPDRFAIGVEFAVDQLDFVARIDQRPGDREQA